MIRSLKTWDVKKFFFFLLIFLIATNLAILFNILFLRQILGFFFLAILPGVLIILILKLNKIGTSEKFVLSVGLSVSFLMFFGLLINSSLLGLGYKTPLSTVPLLISFNLAFIVLAIISSKINKDSVFSLPDLNLSASEKAFLIVAVMFPALSIFGMHLMNTTDNNIILMFMLFLIPIYVVFVCVFNQKFPKRLYPVVLFLISISLLLMMSLRSNHLLGVDTHTEYYYFRTTLDNLHWGIFGHSSLDACLAISELPTIYQSILDISPEFLFKVLYSLLFSIAPLAIYVLSKKYVGELYGFLTSCYFMSLQNFLWTPLHARTNTAILFFALAIMTLFNDKIDPLKKRVLFIVFMASCMVSHYATTYIFFFIIFGSFLGIGILSKKYIFKKVIRLTIVVLFFALIFFWYSQVTEVAFSGGVSFVEETFTRLNKFFIEESRSGVAQSMLGKDIGEKGIPHMIEFVFTWLTFAFIGIGIIMLIRRYKEMSFSDLNFKKPEFLKEKFEVGYFVIALVCSGLLVAVVLTPHITVGYSLDRAYLFGMVVLSVFFVIGGITLSKNLSLITKGLPKTLFASKKRLRKNRSQQTVKKHFTNESVRVENGSEVRAYLIILLVFIPYFFCVTGVMYNLFGVPRAITLNSEGELYDRLYVHDQECYGAKWLTVYAEKTTQIYTTDGYGLHRLISQGKIVSGQIDSLSFLRHKKIKGYLYLSYNNIIKNTLLVERKACNMSEYSDTFVGKSRIYSNGGSEIWK